MLTMIAYLLNIPRPVLAVLALAIYGVIVRWRFNAPMIIDALLIGLLIYRPSIGFAAWVGFLMALRHVPTFASDLVTIAHVAQFDGWTAHAIMFALPALKVYADAPSAMGAAGSNALPPAIVAASATMAATMATVSELRPVEWLGALNDDKTAPHLGVVGATQLGKTTFVLACLGRRAGLLVITTPKAKDEDPWGGAEAVRLRVDLTTRSFDWSPIEQAIADVHFEMLHRNATNRVKDAPRLNLVIDELSTTLANCGRKTKQQILELWNMGAGAHINVIVADPEVNSRAWGIEGRRDILGNLIFAQVSPGRRWSLGRIDPNGRLLDPRPMDTGQVRALAGEAHLTGRDWPGLSDLAAGRVPAGLLGDLLAGGASAGVPAMPPPVLAAPPALESQQTQTRTDTDAEKEERIAAYMEWRKAKITRDQAKTIRNATGAGVDNDEWAEAGKRINQV